MTLAELCAKVTGHKEKRQLGRNQILERKEKILASLDTTLGGNSIVIKLRVFESGYVLYEENDNFTVFHIKEIGRENKEYETVDELSTPRCQRIVPNEIYMNADWFVLLTIEGNERVERNREKTRDEHVEFSYSGIAEDLGALRYEPDYLCEINEELNRNHMQEVFDYVKSSMNPEQWKIYVLIERDGKRQREIAADMGITQQAVSKSYRKACKKILELRDCLNIMFPEE